MFGAGAVEVGPQPDRHRVRPGEQPVEERLALTVVGALGEELLELVDDEWPLDRVEGGQRLGSRA